MQEKMKIQEGSMAQQMGVMSPELIQKMQTY
jgi:hypothetical protein